MKRILLLGVNGFIGHHLSRRILANTDWEVYGMDMQADRIEELLGDKRFRFFEGDITINKEWIEYHIRKSDTVVPLVAILPILLYIGLVIGAQAFQASPKEHAPAVVLAIIPNVAAWGQTQVDGALAAAGTAAAKLGMDKLAGTGVVYHGMELLAGGAVLAGLVLGAMAAFIIDRKFQAAAAYAFAGAVLSFFGFIHGAQLGVAVSPLVALGYVLFALVCLWAGMAHKEART